jgi:predicted amidophosphoribosyltransferase
VLRRTRYTGTQTALGAHERRTNLTDAIVLDGRHGSAGSLGHARLLLVDDVLTTGSTLNTCAWALAAVGPAHIGAATLAAA